MTSPVDPRGALPPLPPPTQPPPAPGLTEGDWPDRAADAVVDLVGQVRAKTTGPVLSIARALVYGVGVAILALVVCVLFVIFAIRLLDELLPSGVWLPYLIVGALFLGAGGWVFQQRKPKSPAGYPPGE